MTKIINEELFAQMWNDGAIFNDISKAVGMSRRQIARRAEKMGLPARINGRLFVHVPVAMGPRKKPVDQARFTEMWLAGANIVDMQNEFSIGENVIRSRVAEWGLPTRKVGGKRVATPKPAPTPAPKAAPVYHPGLSAAIKRAGSSVQRLGQVATMFKMPYREVMEMAGVQG